MLFPNRIRAALQKTVSFSSPSGPLVGRMQYAPTIGYVRFFKIPMQCPDRVRVILQNTDAILQLGTCGPSKNCPVFAPFGAVCGAYAIRPYDRYVRFFKIPMRSPNWVRVRVQKMDLYTPPSVAYGGAYAIRPYDRVRVPLRNTDAIPRLGTCEGSKNGSVYVTVGGVWWGVCDTPLRPGTCDPSKYRCNSPTGYVRLFEKPPRFRPLRGRGVGVCDTPLQPGTCGPSKNHPVFVPFGAVCGAYALHSYDWVCAILQNTDAILQLGTCEGSKNGSVYATVGGVWWGVCNTSLRPGTCGPSKNYPVFVSFGAVEWGVFDTPLRPGTCDPPKYRCDPLTGYVRGFKK